MTSFPSDVHPVQTGGRLCISSGKRRLFRFSVHFLVRLFVLLLLIVWVLHMFWISTLNLIYTLQIFFHPCVGKISYRRKWQPTPVFLAGKSHGQRSLAGYSPWQAMCKESDTTEQLDNNKQLVKETPESSLASSCGDTVRSPSVNHEENPHQTPSLFAWSWCLDLGLPVFPDCEK